MYPSDLSDAQWTLLAPLFARPDPRGQPERHPRRRVVEAVLYVLREGCRWRALPHDFPPWATVYDHFRRWQARGAWEEAVVALGRAWRQRSLGRARRSPRHAILDRQSVKTAAEGEQRGFHGGKRIKGRSRHVAVDSRGTLLAVRVTAANRADSPEAGAVMAQAVEAHPTIESFTADAGYKAQAEAAARQGLGRDFHVVKKRRASRASSSCPAAGSSSAPLPGSANAAGSPKTTKNPPAPPKPGFGRP